MESLMRIGVRYLHSTGAVASMTMPAGSKVLWLITYLYQRFNHELSLQRKTVKLSPILPKENSRLADVSLSPSLSPERIPETELQVSFGKLPGTLNMSASTPPLSPASSRGRLDRPETPPTGASYS